MVTFGGLTAEEAVAAQQQKQFEQERDAGRIKDPHPVPSRKNQQHLRSVLGDLTLHLEQHLDEMSALARKQWRLEQKLKDPALRQSRNRPAAVARNKQMRAELAAYANDIAELEAKCDRYWQAMSQQSRATRALDWNTEVTEPRLIGKAWTEKAKQFRWPDNYVFSTDILRHIELYFRMELDEAGVFEVPLGKVMEW